MERPPGSDTGLTGPTPASMAPDRVYAIPFDTVWRTAVELAGGGIRGWSLLQQNDVEGLVLAVAPTALRKAPVRVTIRIGLDDDAQTRVDVHAMAERAPSFGAARRRVARFLRALDRAVHARGSGPADRAAPAVAAPGEPAHLP